MAIPTGAQAIYADQGLILVKTETEPGTDAEPTAQLNALMVRSCNVKPIIKEISLERYRHTFASPGVAIGSSHIEWDMEVPMVCPVVNTNYISAPEPPWSPLMKVSGFTATGEIDDSGANDYFAAVINTKYQRYQLVDGQTLTVSVDGAAADTVTFNTADFANINRATAAEIAAVINTDVTGATAVVWRGRVIIATNTVDDTGSIQVTGGTANTALGFPTTEVEAYQIVNRWVYNLASHACGQTCTIYFAFFHPCSDGDNDDEYGLWKTFGAVSNLELMFAQDEECTFKFTGKGSYGGFSTGDFTDLIGSGVVYLGDVDALVGIGATLEFDDYSSANTRTDLASKFSVNLNWTVNDRRDFSADRGIRSFYITRKGSISGSYDPEKWLTTVYDRMAAVFGAARQGLLAVFQSPLGSRLTLQAPNIQFGAPSLNKDGILRYDQPFYLRDDSSAGDDAVVLTFEPQP